MTMDYNFLKAIHNASNPSVVLGDGSTKVGMNNELSTFTQKLEEQKKKYPYARLAQDDVINYNGVTFYCDKKTNSICLGDMSDDKKVLNVPLPSGGHLKVNVENFGDIGKAAGMFSPADLNAIMRAIAQYNHCTSKLDEIEDEEDETFLSDSLKNNNFGNVFADHMSIFDKASANAPEKVRKAWERAANETGYTEGGKMNHISELLVRQVTNRQNGVADYQNVFGSSVESALKAAKELLYSLENPLTPDSNRSESVSQIREQEKEFYRKFIEELEK